MRTTLGRWTTKSQRLIIPLLPGAGPELSHAFGGSSSWQSSLKGSVAGYWLMLSVYRGVKLIFTGGHISCPQFFHLRVQILLLATNTSTCSPQNDRLTVSIVKKTSAKYTSRNKCSWSVGGSVKKSMKKAGSSTHSWNNYTFLETVIILPFSIRAFVQSQGLCMHFNQSNMLQQIGGGNGDENPIMCTAVSSHKVKDMHSRVKI